MSDRLAGKTALITGAASGVGRATAELFAAEGARVWLTDLNAAAGEAAAAAIGGSARFLRHDVADEASWHAVMAAVAAEGALDVLVNNAGILAPGSIEDGSIETFRKLMHVNADSAFLGTQAGVRAMKERGGSIINLASITSWLAVSEFAAYSASKGAVAALTRSAALHCRKSGYPVRVNSVHPDGIATPMSNAMLPPGIDPAVMLFDPKRNRGGRACLPEQVASVLLFLASDDSRHVSGAELRVDNAILGMGL